MQFFWEFLQKVLPFYEVFWVSPTASSVYRGSQATEVRSRKTVAIKTVGRDRCFGWWCFARFFLFIFVYFFVYFLFLFFDYFLLLLLLSIVVIVFFHDVLQWICLPGVVLEFQLMFFWGVMSKI